MASVDDQNEVVEEPLCAMDSCASQGSESSGSLPNVADQGVEEHHPAADDGAADFPTDRTQETADAQASPVLSVAAVSSQAPSLSLVIEGLEDALRSGRSATTAEVELLLGAVSCAARNNILADKDAQTIWKSRVKDDLCSFAADGQWRS